MYASVSNSNFLIQVRETTLTDTRRSNGRQIIRSNKVQAQRYAIAALTYAQPRPTYVHWHCVNAALAHWHCSAWRVNDQCLSMAISGNLYRFRRYFHPKWVFFPIKLSRVCELRTGNVSGTHGHGLWMWLWCENVTRMICTVFNKLY